MKLSHTSVFTALLIAAAGALRAEVIPNPLFTDNAVLQQGMEVPVWGTARDGEAVTVEVCGVKAATTAKDGKWLVKLKGLKPGGPCTMTIRGDKTVTVRNLLVGEVWVCSGQSNMERQLGPRHGQQLIVDWEKERDAAKYPEIRHFLVKHAPSEKPLAVVSGSWVVCSPETVSDFTAVGYFFGRDLHQKLKLPVGLIHSSVGGTPAESWTRRDALEANPELQKIVTDYDKALAEYPPRLEKYKADEPKLLEAYKAAVEKAKAEGKPAPRGPSAPRGPRRPSELYNGMIAPLLPYAIRGVIWYQGESNSGNSRQYRTLFPAMIDNWRQTWGQGEFPFLFVQIAPFERMNPEIREAQLLSWQRTPKTAMAVIVDCGDAKDIHPTFKQPVGARLALAARALAYGEQVEYSGPVYDSVAVQGSRAVLRFTHLGGGLEAKGGPLKGFVVAGADKKFVDAKAEIQGDTVVVTAPEGVKPVAVRYGWANVPDVNLFNKAGLPATPFRTDVD